MRFYPLALVLLVLLNSSIREVSGTQEMEFKIYHVIDIGEYRAVLKEKRNANLAGTIAAEKCRKNGAHMGTEMITRAGSDELVKTHRLCCRVRDCPLYVRNDNGTEILTIKGMRFFGDFPVDKDLQSLGELESGFCVSLQGYYESERNGDCLFRVDRNGVFGGSFTSFTPTGTESLETLKAEYGCRQRLGADDYVLSCFCANNNTECSYSRGYQERVAIFQDMFMRETGKRKAIAELYGWDIDGRSEDVTSVEFFHRNLNGDRKVHCAYGQLAENRMGAGEALRKNVSVVDGGYFKKNIAYDDIPEPRSDCGLKITFSPISNENSVFNATADMNSFEECDRNMKMRQSSWVHMSPTCPINVKPNDQLTFLLCCRDSDACNHISNFFNYKRLTLLAQARHEFGFHFPWTDACGDTLVPYYDLLTTFKAFCTYFYDIQKKQIVKLYDFKELKSSGTIMEIDGNTFECKRVTAIITRHNGCPEKFNYYDDLDSPVRDIVSCKRLVQYELGKSIPRIPEERLIELFDSALNTPKLDFRCMAISKPLDMYFARDDMNLMTESSNYSACFLRLDALQGSSSYILSAGVVSEKDDTVFGFYSEHFVSQMLTEGVAFAYNSTEESAVLICAGSSRCNEEEGFVERLLSLYHVNTIDTDFVAEVECGAKKCTDFSGCYRSRQHGEGVDSEDEEGCIADIASEQIHLFVCRAIVLLRTEHSCHDLRLREDGINKFYRVCCHLHGGDKYLDDWRKPFTWPLGNK